MLKMFKAVAGFTLAEVLITLAIIGVVAALTIPALMANAAKGQYVTALKKNYSAFSQAYKLILNDNGGDPTFTGDNDIITQFATKMNFIKKCDDAAGAAPCWYTDHPKTLNKVDDPIFYDDLVGQSWTGGGILQDGTIIGTFSYDPDCNSNQGDGPLQNVCGVIYVDVNGAKKPNIVGRDLFSFYITKTGLVPEGSNNGLASDGNGSVASCDADSGTYEASIGCTAKVIDESTMDY